MKKVVLLVAIMINIFACKEETKESTKNENVSTETVESKIGIKQLKGEFIYFSDAAVLQTTSEVYGVEIDSMMHVLENQAKQYKKESTDMIPVAIRGEVSEKPENEEGWPYRVKVLEILKVYKPTSNNDNVIKIEKQIQ